VSGIFEKVVEVVALSAGEPATNVSRETSLADICDSLERCEVTMDLESFYNIEIPDDDVDSWDTIADIVETVEEVAGLA